MKSELIKRGKFTDDGSGNGSNREQRQGLGGKKKCQIL